MSLLGGTQFGDMFKPVEVKVQTRTKIHLDTIKPLITEFHSKKLHELAEKAKYYESQRNGEPSAERARADIRLILDAVGTPERRDAYYSALNSIPGLNEVWGEKSVKRAGQLWLDQTPYIMALTDPIICEYKYSGTNERYDLGQYIIMLPVGGSQDGIHWVPKNDPKAFIRHPHHYMASDGRGITCWGGFGRSVRQFTENGLFLELLRLAAMAIHTYDQTSQLRNIRSVQHKVLLP